MTWLWLAVAGGLAAVEVWLGPWLTILGVPLPWVWLGVYMGCLWLPRRQWVWMGLLVGAVMDGLGWQVVGMYSLYMVLGLWLLAEAMGGLDRRRRAEWWLWIGAGVAVLLVGLVVYEMAWLGGDGYWGGQLGYVMVSRVGLGVVLGVGPALVKRREGMTGVERRIWP